MHHSKSYILFKKWNSFQREVEVIHLFTQALY